MAYHYFDFDGILCIEQAACPSWLIIILILMEYSALSKLSIVDYNDCDFDLVEYSELSKLPIVAYNYDFDFDETGLLCVRFLLLFFFVFFLLLFFSLS